MHGVSIVGIVGVYGVVDIRLADPDQPSWRKV
jgi:hypothetical protein